MFINSGMQIQCTHFLQVCILIVIIRLRHELLTRRRGIYLHRLNKLNNRRIAEVNGQDATNELLVCSD
jgi:hypothetical protein